MFDFLKRNKTKKKTTEEPGMIKTTATSFEPNRVETTGVLVGEPKEELAKPPTTKETEDGEVVVELGQFENDRRVAESEEKPDTFDIAPSSARKSALFTEEECAKIEEQYKKHERFSDEELESKRKVEEALNDPDIPASNIDELWTHLCRVEGKFGMDEEEEYSSKEEAIKDNLGDRDWVESNPEEKTVQDMTGQEFAEIIQQAQNPQNEELEQSTVEFEGVTEQEEATVESVDEELAEPASEAFKSRANDPSGPDYWDDIAEEIELEANAPDNTEVLSVNPGYVFRTANQSMREELQYEASSLSDGDNVSILSDCRGVLEAHVIDPSKYR